MKQALIFVICIAVGFAGGVLWKHHASAPVSAAAPVSAEKEPSEPQISHDTNGNTIVTLNEKAQKDLGIEAGNPVAFQMSPESKGYGQVLDPAALAALAAELASGKAAYAASSAELSRLKTLEGQGNASARVLQAAEAAAQRDLLAIQLARERLTLSWGQVVADQKDLPSLVQSLVSLEAALVRIDLPMGETMEAPPTTARIATLSGQSVEATFLEPAPSVDPQTQGRGFIFLVRPNSLRLTAGQSVIGYLKTPGEPQPGVIVPREAVVRAEGTGWVYVRNAAGDTFTRVEVPLDHPTETGWFVGKGPFVRDRVVVAGAQQLLSFELRGKGEE